MAFDRKKYNLDRVLIVKLWKSGSFDPIIIAYAPLFDPRLNPKIEVSVKKIPNNSSTRNKGWSAEIRLFNTGTEFRTIIGNSLQLLSSVYTSTGSQVTLDKAKFEKWLNSQTKIEIYAGYYRSDKTNRLENYTQQLESAVKSLDKSSSFKSVSSFLTTEEKELSNALFNELLSSIGDHKVPIYEGFVNNTWSYLEGRDEVTFIQAWGKPEVKFNPQESASNFNDRRELKISFAKKFAKATTVMDAMSVAISNMADVYFNPAYKNWDAPTTIANSTGGTITEILGKKQKFPPDKTITKLVNGQQDGVDFVIKVRDRNSLEGKGLPDMFIRDPKQYVPSAVSGNTLGEILDSLIRMVRVGGNAWAWEMRPDTNNFIMEYTVYPITPNKIGSRQIDITNYQNLLEAPTASPSGQLSLKLMFDPRLDPLDKVRLHFDELEAFGDKDENKTSFSNLAYSNSLNVSGTSNFGIGMVSGPHFMSLQAQNRINNSKDQMGYIFETYFSIFNTDHVLHTHDSTWETNIKTIPITGGIPIYAVSR